MSFLFLYYSCRCFSVSLSCLAPHPPQGCHSVPTYRGTHGIYSVFGRLYAAIGSGSTLGSESAAGSAADSSEVE